MSRNMRANRMVDPMISKSVSMLMNFFTLLLLASLNMGGRKYNSVLGGRSSDIHALKIQRFSCSWYRLLSPRIRCQIG